MRTTDFVAKYASRIFKNKGHSGQPRSARTAGRISPGKVPTENERDMSVIVELARI
jgi:hypothetical protein